MRYGSNAPERNFTDQKDALHTMPGCDCCTRHDLSAFHPLIFDRRNQSDVHAAARQLFSALCGSAENGFVLIRGPVLEKSPGKRDGIEILNDGNLVLRHWGDILLGHSEL